MKRNFDLFGIRAPSLEEARAGIEESLGITLTEHDSSYRAGTYYLHRSLHESMILQRNFDPLECEWFESQFTDYPVVLYVNGTDRSEQIRSKLEGDGVGVCLRSETLDV